MVFYLGDDNLRVFLVAGKAGCGKNEVAHELKNNLDNSVITSF